MKEKPLECIGHYRFPEQMISESEKGYSVCQVNWTDLISRKWHINHPSQLFHQCFGYCCMVILYLLPESKKYKIRNLWLNQNLKSLFSRKWSEETFSIIIIIMFFTNFLISAFYILRTINILLKISHCLK